MSDQEMDYLVEKKVEYLVDMKLGKLKTQLEEATSQFQKMKEEMDVLKNKVQRLNMGVSPQTKLCADTSAGKEEVKKEVDKAPNSRTGDLTPDDVSVEKMFYFGNKAK